MYNSTNKQQKQVKPGGGYMGFTKKAHIQIKTPAQSRRTASVLALEGMTEMSTSLLCSPMQGCNIMLMYWTVLYSEMFLIF